MDVSFTASTPPLCVAIKNYSGQIDEIHKEIDKNSHEIIFMYVFIVT